MTRTILRNGGLTGNTTPKEAKSNTVKPVRKPLQNCRKGGGADYRKSWENKKIDSKTYE